MALVMLSMLLIPLAYTAKPQGVEGSFDYEYELLEEPRLADGNVFVYAKEWETWTGDFEGTAESVFRVTQFSSGFWNVWLRGAFAGMVQGKQGTMVFQLVGKKPAGEDWYGQWVIISGTGELENLQGQGAWWGPGFGAPGPDIYYSGSIHFN